MITRRRANQILRSLRSRTLMQQEPDGYVLTDEGLTSLARRDRAAVGPTLDRWTPQRSGDTLLSVPPCATSPPWPTTSQRGVTEFPLVY